MMEPITYTKTTNKSHSKHTTRYIPLKMHYFEYILTYGCESPPAPHMPPTRENTPEPTLPQFQSPENGSQEFHQEEKGWMKWILYPFAAFMRRMARDDHPRDSRAGFEQLWDGFMGEAYEASSYVLS